MVGWGGGGSVAENMIPECSQQGFTKTITDITVYSRLTTANGFLFKTLPNRKRGCNVQTTYARLLQYMACWVRPARRISQDGESRRERGGSRTKMQMGWLIQWRKDMNEPMILMKGISQCGLTLRHQGRAWQGPSQEPRAALIDRETDLCSYGMEFQSVVLPPHCSDCFHSEKRSCYRCFNSKWVNRDAACCRQWTTIQRKAKQARMLKKWNSRKWPPNMLTALFDQVHVVFVFILICYTVWLKTKQEEKRKAKSIWKKKSNVRKEDNDAEERKESLS